MLNSNNKLQSRYQPPEELTDNSCPFRRSDSLSITFDGLSKSI